jgi:hypothetical protein
MKSRNTLGDRDLVVRFNPASRSISFHIVSVKTGEPMANPFHEVEWSEGADLATVIDIGAAVCANLLSRFPNEFCTELAWERIASDIRIATGRDDDE